jgi:S1-C subfamily serine protease
VKFGKVTRPILGIKFAPDQSVEQLGVSGVLVLDAPATGPAGKAVSLLFIYFIMKKSVLMRVRRCLDKLLN